MRLSLNNFVRLLSGEIPFRYKIRAFFTSKENNDDYNWDLYNDHYRIEVLACQKDFTLILEPEDYEFSKEQFIQKNTKKHPLSPNHRILYEVLLQLNSQSVLEVGCGGGDHLRNLNLLMPETEIFGFDLSEDQLSYLKERHPNLQVSVSQNDITLPYSNLLPKVETVYSQAVIMHIQTANAHLVSLTNMFRMASKHVVLMENWTRHRFMDDIQMLFERKMIPWKNIHFYYKFSPELNKPHLMIVSQNEIRLKGFEPLENYDILYHQPPEEDVA